MNTLSTRYKFEDVKLCTKDVEYTNAMFFLKKMHI